MIVTNPDLRPKARLLQAVSAYFEKQGFNCQNSPKAFIRPFTHGYQKVDFWFKISTLVSVSMQWAVQFEKLEKVVATVSGHPKKFKQHWTIGSDLPIHTRWLGVEHTFPLFNPNTLGYDDLSINQAAAKLMDSYEQFVIPYFEKYQTYAALEKYYNEMPFKQIRGIILAKYVNHSDFEALCQTFLEQIKRRNGEGNSEERSIYNKTNELLHSTDIKKLLD